MLKVRAPDPSTVNPAKAALSAYLLVGDDPHLSAVALSKLLEGVEEASVNQFGPDDEFERIVEAVHTPPMFADRRTVVIFDVDRFQAEPQRQIIRYLEDPPPGVTLVIMGAKLPPRMMAAARKSGHVIDTARGRRSDLLAWLRQRVSAAGLHVSGNALGTLVDVVGDQRLALAQAVEELSLAVPPGTRLGSDQISRQFRGRADVKLFGFVDLAAGRQAGAALESLHYLIARGEPPQMLFWALSRHFRMLLQASGASASQVAGKLGLPEWRAEKLVRQARGFSEEALVRAYRALAEADLKMKTSQEPEVLALERAVVAIAGA